MAREGYRSPPPLDQPYQYDQPGSRYPPPPTHHSSHHHHHDNQEYERLRPQNMSSSQSEMYNADPARFNQARQPIDDAVNSAFRGTETNHAIPPEILNRITSTITANVMQQLKATNLPTPVNTQPAANHVAGGTSPSYNGSPPMDHSKVYTPPSPEDQVHPPTSPTHRPSQVRAQDVQGRSGGRASPAVEQRPTSPQSQASQADEFDTKDPKAERATRPKGPRRLSTGQDPTILEKIWGTLFDDEGQTTIRFGQFLRGIAVHLIEDYEPKHSLVVTSAKMRKFYEATKLPQEIYPWTLVFDDRTSSVSRMYRELEVQHHLIQEKLDERPEFPGLTPKGFETWMTWVLKAHPDHEFERLAKTALDMPISNPDERKERFPKEISRRLFPLAPDHNIREKIGKAMATHCKLPLPLRNPTGDAQAPPAQPATTGRPEPTMQPPPIQPLSSSMRDGSYLSPTVSRHEQPPVASNIERDRKPHSAAPSDSAVDTDRDEGDDDAPTPQPIERERKPYVAVAGGGKNYDDVNRPSSPDLKVPPPSTRLGRSESVASHGSRPGEMPRSKPIPISIHQRPTGAPAEGLPTPESAPPAHHRTNSSYHHQGRPGERPRLRSPSAGANGRGYGHASESDMAYGSSYKSVDSTQDWDEARRYREEVYQREREKYANDKYDPNRMKAYDPREREREGRQRFQSTVGVDGGSRPYYHTDDDYHRHSSYVPMPDTYPGGHPSQSYR